MDPRSVLRELFGALQPGGSVEIRRVPSHGTPTKWVDPTDPELPPDTELQNGSNWFFGLCARNNLMEITSATMVWADIDAKTTSLPDPTTIYPRPTLTVNSGSGLHVYWALDRVVDPLVATRLSRLAAMALDGDRHVLNSTRVMRLPGTLNHKYTPPLPCEVNFHSDAPPWDPELLEEALLAAFAKQYWDDGLRHAVALALAGVLAKTGWSEDRVIRCFGYICDFTDDDQRTDRIVAGYSTVRRYQDGKPISTRELRDVLGKDTFKELLDALGLSQNDGDLIYQGTVIGHTAKLELAVINAFIGLGEWAYAEGGYVKWCGTHWALVPEEVLTSDIFNFLTSLRYLMNGDEVEFVPSTRLAGGVTRVIKGKFAEKPLPPPVKGLLPLANGVLELATRVLRPPAKDDYLRYSFDATYDPEATCPTWLEFLKYVAPQEIPFLQEWFGYCLTPGNPWQRMLWLCGESGTGKSTFLGIIGKFFGPAHSAINTDKLTDYVLASLVSSMVATCSEISNKMLRTGTLKALVGGDAVPARNPYGRPFTIIFPGKFVWSSNSLPPVDQGEGLWRRLVVIPFDHHPTQMDVNLAETLEGELSGILNWALEGKQRVDVATATSSWPLPPKAAKMVAEYQDAADNFKQFVTEELELGESFEVAQRELYASYALWAKEHGHRIEPLGPIFRRELVRFGIAPSEEPKLVDGRPVPTWTGARIRPSVFLGNLTP